MAGRQSQPWSLSYSASLTAGSCLLLAIQSVVWGDSPAPSPEIPLLTNVPVAATSPSPLDQSAPSVSTNKRWVRRHRAVTVNHAALDVLNQGSGQNRPTVTIDLFDSRRHQLELESPRQGYRHARVWRGRLRGEPGSDVALARQGDLVIGTILSDNHLFKLEVDGTGRQGLVEIDVDALPEDHQPVTVPDGTDDPAPAPTTTPVEATPPTALADDGSLVDLLVAYTTTAKDQEGGQAAFEALIALGVDQANQAYSNSQITIQLRLVQTVEVAYTESGAIDTDLSRLRSTADGTMDQVHQLRDQYKADLVALIVDNGGGFCGIAYVMTNGPQAGFASSAFSVTARDCIVGHTLAHEMGHNMGNAHDRATGGTGVFPYSHGYRDEVGRFRTIMAYDCPTVPCPRVKYFSTPRVQLNGRPLGIDHNVDAANSADNARSMNEVRVTVANWRVSGTTDTTPPAAPANFRFLTP